MYTTIKISQELKAIIDQMKVYEGETYEQVIEDLIEDHLTLNPKVAKELEISRGEIRKGNFVTLAELKGKMRG